MKKYWLPILLILIFSFGFAIRAIEVLTNNYVFLFDQGRDYLAVQDIVVNRKLTLIGASTGLHGIFHGPFWYYLLAIPFILWQGDPYGGQVLMLVLGLLTLILMYLIPRRIFNKKIGLIAFFLTAVCRPIMSQSTMIWNPFPVTVLIVLSFYLFYGYFKSRKPNYLAFGFFSIAMMYHFEVTAAIAFLLYSLLFFLIIDRKHKKKTYVYSFLAIILGFSTAIIFDIRHDFLQLKVILNFLTGKGTSLSAPGFNLLAQQDHLRGFWANFQTTFNLSKSSIGLFFVVNLLGGIWLIRQRLMTKSQRKLFIYLLLFPLVNFVFYIFYSDTVWQWHLTHLYFVYILISSVVAYYLLKKKLIFRLIYIIFLVIMLINSFKILSSRYKNDWSDLRGVAGVKGKLQVIDYIYNDVGGEEFNVFVFTPPIYDYPHQYLLQWYGKKEYGYVPGDQKKGLVYLWIEPDHRKPWTYQGWLETVIKEGEIIHEEKLDSGFIIQKRYVE